MKLQIHLLNLRNHKSKSLKISQLIKAREIMFIIKLTNASSVTVMISKMMKLKLKVHSTWPFTKMENRLGTLLKLKMTVLKVLNLKKPR